MKPALQFLSQFKLYLPISGGACNFRNRQIGNFFERNCEDLCVERLVGCFNGCDNCRKAKACLNTNISKWSVRFAWAGRSWVRLYDLLLSFQQFSAHMPELSMAQSSISNNISKARSKFDCSHMLCIFYLYSNAFIIKDKYINLKVE